MADPLHLLVESAPSCDSERGTRLRVCKRAYDDGWRHWLEQGSRQQARAEAITAAVTLILNGQWG